MVAAVTLSDLLLGTPTTTVDALAAFDAAEPVEPEFMIGIWHGAEVPTGHPLDGFLEASGWWGKQFVDAETVPPLLFPTSDTAALWALNPVLAFGGLGIAAKIPVMKDWSFERPIAALRPLLATRRPKARLRTTRYRGVDTATMVYDQLPIHDVFRKIDDQTVIGAMDLRGSRKPYFFALTRDDSVRVL